MGGVIAGLVKEAGNVIYFHDPAEISPGQQPSEPMPLPEPIWPPSVSPHPFIFGDELIGPPLTVGQPEYVEQA